MNPQGPPPVNPQEFQPVNPPVNPVNPANPANFQIVNEYNSFNLANITPPVAPKWRQPENLLDEFRKFKRSCLRIFDGPMCHITSGKVKTSMLLIWSGPDGEDIYDNFNLPPHQANDVDYVLQRFEEFCEPICNFRAARFKFTKVCQRQNENIDTFYNRILKLARQCEFSDVNEQLIDAIIFGTNCIKAQDKLLQTPNTLSLQQCLTVCRHYESLSLHIQQIRSDKQVEFLRKRHQKSKKSVQQKPQQKGQTQRSPQPPLSSQQKFTSAKSQKKCFGCGREMHKDRSKNCPAWGSTCRKCNKLNHWENVCGQVPKKSSQRRPVVSEIRNSASITSQTIPKQVFDIVDVANSVDNLSHSYKRQLELNTLTSQSSTHSFSNIQINGVTLRCKQDTGAEVCVMPLNVFDRLNSRLDGGLKLCPVTDVQVIGYSKQTVEIVGKITVNCTHLNTTKRCVFYVTNLTDNKVLLGLTFCKAFNLVKIICDEDCSCKKVTSSVDILNEFPAGLDVPNQKKQIQVRPPPVDIHTKLRPDCKAHVMELFPEIFEGIGTIKDAIMKLNVDDSITPVIQPPRKIPQAMVGPLKQEIERMMMLGVIRKLDINQATDWCHNLVLVRKPNGKL